MKLATHSPSGHQTGSGRWALKLVLWGLVLIGVSACSSVQGDLQPIPATKSKPTAEVAFRALQGPGGLPLQLWPAPSKTAPTVLVLHGCGGVGVHDREWAQRLQAWGYTVVVVDSFSTRTRENVCVRRSVSPRQRARDALAVAQWVKQQPWSDGHVAAVGFSHGGLSVLMAAASTGVVKGGQSLDAVVAYYPLCLSEKAYPFARDVPLQIHIGRADDWTPAAMCPPLVARWQLADQYFEYEGAHHGFDRAAVDRMVRGRSGLHVLRSDPEAAARSFERAHAFLREHLR